LILAWITLIVLSFHWARVVWSRTVVQLAAEEQRRRAVAEQQSRSLLENFSEPDTTSPDDDEAR
jgi:hypothetical protein